jgi:tetratricopeptide (TPR) repeat protein
MRWKTIAALVAVLLAGIVVWVFVLRAVRDRLAKYRPHPTSAPYAPDSPAASAARVERTMPVVDPAPAPLPSALPLVGGDAVMPDGYPVAHVDGAALRSLLWFGRYRDLDNYIEQLEDAFEKDNRREYWMAGVVDAFGSAEDALTPKLDAWAAATPLSFAPYLARATHWNAVGWARRGEKWSRETPASDIAAMDEALGHAIADADKALILRRKLVAARIVKLRALSAHANHAAMRAEVDRALKQCPTCMQIRFIYLLDTTPRWGGTYDEMHAFAATCTKAINPRCPALDGVVDDDQANLARIADRLPEAEAAANRAIAKGDSSVFYLERAQIRINAKSYDGALTDAETALALRYAPDALVARADALYGLKRYEEAAGSLLQATRIDPTESRAKVLAPAAVNGLLYEAWNRWTQGQREDALRMMDLAAELAPNDRNVLGRRSAMLFDGTSDVPALEDAVAKNPDDFRAHQRLDYALSRTGDWPRIVAMWTEYIGRHPDDARAYLERGGTYSQLHDGNESHADALKACTLGLSEGCARAGVQ